MKKILVTILVALGLLIGIPVLAIPSTNFFQNVIPITDSTYDLGSTAKKWANIYTDNLDTGLITVSGSAIGNLSANGCFKAGTTSTSTLCGNGAISTFIGGFISSASSTVLGNFTITGNSTSTNATTTNLFSTKGTFTNIFGALTGNVTGDVSGNAGTVTNGVYTTDAGTVFEVPLTAGVGLTRTVNDFACDTASGSTFGCLSSANWTTFNNKVSSQWTTSGSNIYYTTGNVGIGTTSPGFPLDVQAAIGAIQAKSTTGTNYAYVTSVNTGGQTYIGKENSVGGSILTGTSAYAGVLATTGAYPLQFGVNNAVAMTILNGGNVGIGTTGPSAALDVVSNSSNAAIAEFRQSHTSNDGHIIIDSPTDNNARPSYLKFTRAGVQHWDIGSGYGSDNFQIATTHLGTDVSGSKVTITTAGNVGIGTTAPASILHIDKGTGNGQITLDGSTGGCIMLRDTDDAGWTEVRALNGVLTASIDADGVCD